jgi:penicillin-binding protein 1A
MEPPDLDPRIDALSRRRRRSRLHRRSARRAVLLGLGLVTVLVTGACAAVTGVFVNDPAALVRCDLGSQHIQALGRSTFASASDGSRLGAVPSTRNREPVPLGRMSPWLLKATVAVEDARFWTRPGALDPQAITRAAVADVRARRVVEGGSTIPQQLARDRYLRAPAPTLSRKLQEACLATHLVQRHSRRAILQDYLDGAYYGHHAYGVKAAAETYFSRPADRLTMVQAALLAGLPQAPTVFDPLEHPAAARRRRHEVLAALLASGAISAPRYRAADRGPLHLRPGARYATGGPQPFFEYARRELIERVGRWHAMHGGLHVSTTLDPHMQRLATASIDHWLGRPGQPAAALVAIDPSTGAIRAMSVVAPGHRGAAFNLASQSHRQAGSTFKTFALAAAMEAGIPLRSVWHGPPALTISDPRCMNGTAPWLVHNYADESQGTMSLLQATALSVNTIYAQVVMKVGPRSIVNVAHRMGVRSPLEPVCSIALGPEGVSPLEMTDAFATLAARGVHHAPSSLAAVTAPDGERVPAASVDRGDRALSPSVADRVAYALSGVIRAGTGTAADIGRPAAGKTGTAEGFKDAWFCGFVPRLATCVWVGYPRAEVPLGAVDGFAQVVGGSVPARIWHDFMVGAVAGTKAEPLPAPAPGLLTATADSSRTPVWPARPSAPRGRAAARAATTPRPSRGSPAAPRAMPRRPSRRG